MASAPPSKTEDSIPANCASSDFRLPEGTLRPQTGYPNAPLSLTVIADLIGNLSLRTMIGALEVCFREFTGFLTRKF